MKTFFKNFFFTTIGVIITLLSIYVLPQFILNAEATTTSNGLHPLQDVSRITNDRFRSSRELESPIPYALPKMNIMTYYGTYDEPGPIQMDMNGDGLLDLVYSKTQGGTTSSVYQFVLLNTGNGFEKAYTCRYIRDTNNNQSYWGHCADPDYAI